MAKRKTPVLLREAPSGRINALTNYRYRYVKGAGVLQVVGDGKHDVTADFDALICEHFLNDCPDIVAQLDGAPKAMELTPSERREIRVFRRKLIEIIERHNAGPHVKKGTA